jgi:outer membrane lipoprotein SlyB
VPIRITHKEHIMEASTPLPAAIGKPQTHPLLLVAAASVTVFSLAGVGALAGWLPGPGAHNADAMKVATVTTPAPAAAPISVQQTVTVPQEKVKPAAKSVERAPARVRHAEATPAQHPAVAPAASFPAVAVSPAPTYAAVPMPAICVDCGVVESVREVAVEAKGSGGGAITGGVVGGFIGNQLGRGATRDIATVLGAVGGAFAGNHIEKSVKESKRYDVLVRFEDGSTRTFSSDSPPAWQSGDRVKLQNGLLTIGGGRSSDSRGSI